jgi:hypothetical protein
MFNSFRMSYTVEPGLYAVGSPGPESEVLVSANYKLSFDHLRRSLGGIDAWVLVLDTKGINVWCAAGKGTFGTGEIIRRVEEAGLKEVVSHRRLVLPQLGAPGVQAHGVKKATGFRVHYGPVRAADIRGYLDAGLVASPEMRKVRFPFMDRLVLTPMEIVPAMRHFPMFAVLVLAVFGLRPEGVLFWDAFYAGGPFVLLGLASVLSGALLTPALLPWVPTRSFALKGLLVGAAVTWLMLVPAGVYEGVGGVPSMVLVVLSFIFFPAASSYIALQFTGSTTYTGMSGVNKELKYMLPVYLTCLGGSLVLLVAYKVITWGAA